MASRSAAKELKKIANIIAWNFWQMDGLTGTVPLGEPEEEIHQYSLFEMLNNEGDSEKNNKTPKCRVFDWRSDKSIVYESMKKQYLRDIVKIGLETIDGST